MTHSLYLLPTGAADLLAPEPLGGAVPSVCHVEDHEHVTDPTAPLGFVLRGTGNWRWEEWDGNAWQQGAERALALVHDGRVLPLAWWRAIQTLHAAQPSTPIAPPVGMLALDLAEHGAALGLWRVVRVETP